MEIYLPALIVAACLIVLAVIVAILPEIREKIRDATHRPHRREDQETIVVKGPEPDDRSDS